MVGNSFSLLCGIWKSIGPFNMDLFSQRLLLQKKIFLLQESGMNLGYEFSKYLRGPYCSILAHDGYTLNSMEKIEEDINCSKDFVQKVNNLEKGHEEDIFWFELLGSITYLINKEKKNKEEVKEILLEEKPYLFEDNNFDEALKILADNKIIN